MATAAPISAERAASLGGPLLAATVIILLFFGGLGSWAVLAPLARAAVAPAVVAPENYRKTVQHLEGGIVQEIMVRDGSKVEAGDLLLRLDDTQIRAAHAAARSRLAALQAREARLTAEQNGTADIRFPDELLALAAESPEIARLVGAERAALAARRQALADQVAMLKGRLAQSQANLKAYKAGTASLATQLRLIDEEIGTVKDLVDRGLDRKPRLLGLQRARADLEGELATTAGSIASTQELIGAVSAELASVTSRYTEEVATGLAEARAEATEFAARARSARDQLQRTVIHAPVAGTVVQLRQHTLGGVIKAGDPILDILPRDEPLVIEARVSPADIDVVHPGLPADIHLLAYSSRHMPRIRGEVRKVSADRLTDPNTDQPYYAVQIVIDPAALQAAAPQVELSAGMPAEALILTGERTLLDYLLEPIRFTFRRALRET
jgi:HlyD family type I secretion membrane fusion protein